MCEALISANIPLNGLSKTKFKKFLETYTKNEIPCEATLRKGYVDDIYMETINTITENIWVSIDETADAKGRFISNVIVGTLEEHCAGDIFLLNSYELDKANHSTICKLFDKSMNVLFTGDILHNNVLLFLSDTTHYIVKASEVLKLFYIKMIHITYFL